MNSPLVYLMLMRAKNTLKRFFKTPGRIVIALLLAVSLGFTLLGGQEAAAEREITRDIAELQAIAYLFYTMIFIMTAGNGFSKGASLFTMADVNLIFPAPIRRQTVLFYGLVRQLGTSLLVGFFLLFQYTTVSQFYDIRYLDLVWIVLGYGAAVFSGQLFAMAAYTLTSGDERLRRRLQVIFYDIYIAAGVYFLANLLPDPTNFLAVGTALLNRMPLLALPVSGWLAAAVRGLMNGDPIGILAGFGVTAAALAGLVMLIAGSDREYYEDVLAVTESNHALAAAQKSGKTTERVGRRGLKRQGIGKGMGAAVLYHKHMLENRRTSTLMLEPTTLIFAVISVVFAWIMKSEGGVLAGFIFAVYLQMFAPGMGRLAKELTRPYIYLIPEPAVKKLFWAMAECLPRLTIASVITYLPIALLCGLGIPEALCCVLAGFSFGVLFTAGHMAVERMFSGLTIKALVMLIYFVVMVVLAVPAIVTAVLLSGISAGMWAMFAGMAGVNLLIAAAVIFASRNMLRYAELNMQ